MTARTLSILAGAGILAASLLGCGGSTANSTSSGSAGPQSVVIKNFAFAPPSLTVAVGTTVTWTNSDPSTHTVTADDKSFDAGNVDPTKSFTHVFATAGTYSYHCNIHQFMRASITVTG